MGRNRGQNQQGKKKGGEEKGKIRRSKPWRWPRNRERNLLREANRAERKLDKLLKRGIDMKPGGIMSESDRSARLDGHIARLKAQAKTFPAWL